MLIQESFVNASEGHRYGESEWYEPFTSDLGKLYKSLMREYGRCIGKVYIDTADSVKAIGWVFVKRVPYDDSPKTYLREVWVSVANSVTRSVSIDYVSL